jgi:2-iminobutanoate/2-iminopropanoate deaminase
MTKKSADVPLLTPARIVGNLVFTSGSATSTGNIRSQIRYCLEQLKERLERAGASLETVDKATVYLTDMSDREKYLNEIWREYFPTNPPCRTTVQVVLGPNTKVEIEMIAHRK